MRPMVASCSDSSRSCWVLSRLALMRSKARGELGDFVAPGRIIPDDEVAALQGANARHQASQRPRERVGDKNTNALPTRTAARPSSRRSRLS